MNWKRMHHLYLGLFFAFCSFGWTAVKVGMHDLDGITKWLIIGIGFGLWALDDSLYHQKGWKTPCYHLEQLLREFKVYRKFSDWLNKTFFKVR